MAKPAWHAAIGLLGCAVALTSLVAEPGYPGLFGAALGLLMLAIAIIDACFFIIPDALNAAAFTLGLVAAAATSSGGIVEPIATAALRGIALSLLFLGLRDAYWRLRRRQGIGLGDVKLAAVAGAWLDWTLIPVAIEIAALGALTGYFASRLFLRRPLSPVAKLPFGLFFAPAIWLCWLIGVLFFKS